MQKEDAVKFNQKVDEFNAEVEQKEDTVFVRADEENGILSLHDDTRSMLDIQQKAGRWQFRVQGKRVPDGMMLIFEFDLTKGRVVRMIPVVEFGNIVHRKRQHKSDLSMVAVEWTADFTGSWEQGEGGSDVARELKFRKTNNSDGRGLLSVNIGIGQTKCDLNVGLGQRAQCNLKINTVSTKKRSDGRPFVNVFNIKRAKVAFARCGTKLGTGHRRLHWRVPSDAATGICV